MQWAICRAIRSGVMGGRYENVSVLGWVGL
jgi:hypothetical protein